MSGKRLLDSIEFLSVAKSVTLKHAALRRRQWDVYIQTSSLTKGVKNQADSIILTARAAAALARRFNEPTQSHSSAETASLQRSHQAPRQGGHNAQPGPVVANDVKGKGFESNDAPTVAPGEAGRLQRQVESRVSVGQSPVTEPNAREQNFFDAPARGPTLPKAEMPEAMNEFQGSDASLSDEKTKPDSFPPGRNISWIISERGGYNRASPKSESCKGQNDLQGTVQSAQETYYFPQEPVTDSIRKSGETKVTLPRVEAEATHLVSEANDSRSQMVESRVPSSRLGRLWQYGGLATSMAFGVLGESIRRTVGDRNRDAGSLMFNARNIERLVAKLSKMRGAALKLGQMMSLQDSSMFPESIAAVLQRVQDRADYMPISQRDQVLHENLGANWRDLFETFDELPMAAASIGQVHGAVLKKTGQRVAVKIQYPGVADSIDADLDNLSILLNASRLLPKGLFLNKTIANARTELAWECDYLREAQCAERFRNLLADQSSIFTIPSIIHDASGKQVLTMERMNGVAVTKIQNFTQEQRDWIGTQILRLCFREICEFRFMQTDPNWTNFLYNDESMRLELLDFGASREYPADFINTYICTLVAASRNNRYACRELSAKLGYLTGYEASTMVDAHIDSVLTLAEPFMDSAPDIYDFQNQTITDRVRALIPTMLRERLTPPPEETYSLHRKLSGAFLLCAKLGSRVPGKEVFQIAIRTAEKSRLISM